MPQKFFNKRSSVITEDGNPKLPSSDALDYGEIAINYADGVETISIKNSANEIVEFKSKEYIDSVIAQINTATPLTILTTNDTSPVDLHCNDIVVFTTEQASATKTFNIVAPNDTTNEYTWTLRFKTGNSAPSITFNVPNNYTLRWANNTAPTFNADTVYEITFKYMPTLNIMLGVWGGF